MFAQESKTFSFTYKNQKLGNVLKEISAQTGYEFAYSSSELNLDTLISFIARKQTIADVLKSLGKAIECKPEMVGQTIVLKPYRLLLPFAIKGIICDYSTGDYIVGANVITDSKTGTYSDSLGQFSIAARYGQALTISCVGYNPLTYRVVTDTLVLLKLHPKLNPIDEIIVVAFGKEQRNLLTGSVSVIDPQQFSQLNDASVMGSFQANLTGVLIQNNAGTPG